jgi:hypothetical protein
MTYLLTLLLGLCVCPRPAAAFDRDVEDQVQAVTAQARFDLARREVQQASAALGDAAGAQETLLACKDKDCYDAALKEAAAVYEQAASRLRPLCARFEALSADDKSSLRLKADYFSFVWREARFYSKGAKLQDYAAGRGWTAPSVDKIEQAKLGLEDALVDAYGEKFMLPLIVERLKTADAD